MTLTALTNGHPFNLSTPDPASIDFAEIARVLARLPRYGARTRDPISVAMHTLIGCTMANEDVMPYWLLHDAHEAYIGDIQRPVQTELNERQWPAIWAIDGLAYDIDCVIWRAAGLPYPFDEQPQEIDTIDNNCLHIERACFMHPQQFDWGIPPYTGPDILFGVDWNTKYPNPEAALLERFRAYLPALRGKL